MCVLCEFAVAYVEHKILTNRTVDMAERAIQMFCAYLPESVAEKCEAFVDDYGDEIIRMILEEELGPKAACTALNICPLANGDRMFGEGSFTSMQCTVVRNYLFITHNSFLIAL